MRYVFPVLRMTYFAHNWPLKATKVGLSSEWRTGAESDTYHFLVWSVYQVFQKTDPLFYFDDNFGKYGPILTIFSLLQQEIYEAQKLSYFSHLIFIMLPMQIFLDHASKQISMYSSG